MRKNAEEQSRVLRGFTATRLGGERVSMEEDWAEYEPIWAHNLSFNRILGRI